MDQDRIDDEPQAEEPQAPVAEGEAPTPKPPAELPRFEGLSTGKEPWKGGGCSSRLPLYGCVISLAVVIAFLMAGTSMVRRTVWSNFDNTLRALDASLPAELPAREAARTRRNLERFRAVLERSDDPYPLMGEFVTRVRSLLDDGRLTPEEVESLNLTLERWIDESGIPPLQLGALGTNPSRAVSVGWVGGNSEFRIPNSEFRIPNSEFRIPNSEFS